MRLSSTPTLSLAVRACVRALRACVLCLLAFCFALRWPSLMIGLSGRVPYDACFLTYFFAYRQVGHYVADVFDPGSMSWCHCDDDVVTLLPNNDGVPNAELTAPTTKQKKKKSAAYVRPPFTFSHESVVTRSCSRGGVFAFAGGPVA